MLRFGSFLAHRFAQIRPIKPQAFNYNPKGIANFFEIPIDKLESEQELNRKYMKYLSTRQGKRKLLSMEVSTFIQANKQFRLIEFTKQQIAKNYKEITPEAQATIDNFCAFKMRMYHQMTKRTKQINQNYIYWKEISNCVISINQFFTLMTPTIQNYTYYAQCLANMHKKQLHMLISQALLLTNYRCCIDWLLNIPIKQFTHQNLMTIFRFMTQVNIHFMYHNSSFDIIKHFWKGISHSWYQTSLDFASINRSFGLLNFYTQNILDVIQKYLLHQSLTLYEKINHLNSLIKFKRINETCYKQEKYKNMIIKLIKESDQTKPERRQFFSKTIQNFYMAELWLPEYWVKFMEFLKTDEDNTVDIYKLYVISRLFEMFKDQIPPQILAAKSPLQNALSQNPNFRGQELIKNFIQKQLNPSKSLSCQLQIANSLRLLNAGTIRTQYQIQFLCVDILLNENCVIEVNGHTHYLVDLEKQNKKIFDLKSTFRAKTLMKLGYQIIDVDLESYAEGSFELIKSIYEIANGTDKRKWIHLHQIRDDDI